MENQQRVRTLKHQVETDSKQVDELVDKLVAKYSRELDDFIAGVKELIDKRERISDEELENMVLNIPVFMYYASSGVETLGVELETAKSIKLNAYNVEYMKGEGTIKDKTAFAESNIKNEALLEMAFNRAYKKLQTKVKMAEHVFSGAKKILTKRIQEINISNVER